MKKVLFVLGLALCSTFAMAQTNSRVGKLCAPTGNEKLAASALEQSVDYKASIFTKDGDDVVLGHNSFASAADFTVGTVQATDVIDDTVVGAINSHSVSGESFRWHRIADTNAIDGEDFAEDYTQFIRYLGTAQLHYSMGARNGITDNNGFMLLSPSEQSGGYNNINTYFSMPPVARQGATLVDVTWRQLYVKYYDVCYLDYKVNNVWYSIEVNVPGIDVEVNTLASRFASVTLPAAALTTDNIELRFRLSSSNAYFNGYGWAIDDVELVVPAATSRWSFNRPGYINGFYGTIPQGMTVPMSYTVFARNIGTDNLSGVNMSVDHRYGTSGEWTNAFTVNQNATLAPGDPFADNVLDINEAGFMYGGHGYGEYIYYHDFPEMYDQYGNTDDELAAAGYMRRGLPSSQPGANQFLITASNAQGLSDTLAGYTYTVSELLDKNLEFGRTVPGYRWGNDNGIVPAGSEFAFGFSGGDQPGYVTEDCGHQYAPNYEVLTRYNTPSAIPTDDNGEPWVIRGIEFVTSTKVTEAQAAGARFSAEIYRYEMRDGNDTGWFNYIRYTGLTGNEIYLVGEGNVAPTAEDLIGFATAENGNYYAVNVLFPDQPAMQPNTSFLLGYTLNGGGDFAVARQDYRYKSATGDFDENSNYTRYRDDPELSPYSGQIYPLHKTYDVYCYDPVQGAVRDNSVHTVNARNIDYYPLIRLIVGPKMNIPSHLVSASCAEDENEQYTYWVHDFRKAICGIADTVLEGGSYSYMVLPGSEDEETSYEDGTDASGNDVRYYVADSANDFLQSKVIDAIYIDGNPVDMNDPNVVTEEDYSVYWAGHTPLESNPADRWEPALVRKAYMISLRDITDDVTISASVHDVPLSIRSVEDNVKLMLAPNPATSQVRLNVSSFSGKANCSIIDMSGRVVYSADITSGETVINLNGVPAGAYFVRVTNDTFSKVEKLIVR